MISTARLLSRSASGGELGSFALMSMLVVILLATGGHGVTQDAPELVGSTPALTETYLSQLVDVLFPLLIVAVLAGFAVLKSTNTARK